MSAIHLIDPLMLWLPHAASDPLLGQLSLGQAIDLHFGFHSLSSPLDLHPLFDGKLDGMQTLLAQQFETDVFKGARASFNHFVKSGQAWALLIGFIIGYVVRGLTTYG